MAYPRRYQTITRFPARDGWVVSFPKKKIPEEERLLFLLIRKNGSSSLLRTFKTKNYYCTVEEFNKSKQTKVVILRDPWNRFISGLRQVYKARFNQRDAEEIFSHLESRRPEETDTHLVLQSWFLKDRQIDHYLKLENIKKEWKTLRKKIKLDEFPRALPNLHPGRIEQKEEIKQFFAENEEFKIKALEYLQPDYELIKRLDK